MKITIFGSGYVGLVTGACLAEVGNDVLCMDIDTVKIDALNNGMVPIHEPGLNSIIQKNIEQDRLRFTSDAELAVRHGLFQFIAVGTPQDEDGSADLQYVISVAETIASLMNEYKIIVNKSTVPVGTADTVKSTIQRRLNRRNSTVNFDVVSNPEFLKEGDAIADFMKPDRIIIGTDNPQSEELLRELYAPFNRNHERVISMGIRSAELTKYAANAMLATKISFMNELSMIAEQMDADIEDVRQGIGSDSRIGFSFIYPGCGYGGSCFPKDVKALIRSANEAGSPTRLISAVDEVNTQQRQVPFNKLHQHFKGSLKDKTIAVWGLSFKPNTDDMRESPSCVLIRALLQAGASIQAYDPIAMREAARLFGSRNGFRLVDKQYDALVQADALVLLTEWQVFRSPDFNRIKNTLKQPVIVDGRNIYDPLALTEAGFSYYGIGRAVPAVPALSLVASRDCA
jgi:UDPglucose 6-dehydrogenase